MIEDFNSDNFKLIKNNEINLNVYCDVIGPLVIMAHGWPESWYSWRHQIKYLVANGFSVAVLDMRGYGDSSKPHLITDYDVKKLTSDIITTADYLKAESFYLIGHDWGAPVVWNTCLDFESRIIKACGMSVPYMVSQSSPIETMKFLFKDYFFYMLYFQNEGIVEKELENDMKSSLMNIYGSLQSDGSSSETFQPKPLTKDMTFLKSIGSFDKIPKWLSEEDFNYYLSRFQNGGMRGPINWYRNIDRNWLITKDTHQLKINVPTCFLSGEDDPVSVWAPIDKNNYSKLEISKIIKGAGHWLQQEKPDEVNKIILDFFKSN